jgi:hypothetical protein
VVTSSAVYDSDFVSTVKVTCNLEWPFTPLVRMNSFQPTADETYDIPTTPGSSRVWQLRLCTRVHISLCNEGVLPPTMGRGEHLLLRGGT